MKNENDLNELAITAIEQIKQRKYDQEFPGEVIYIGLAHHIKEVEMDWQEK